MVVALEGCFAGAKSAGAIDGGGVVAIRDD